jgi:hypothetical protein
MNINRGASHEENNKLFTDLFISIHTLSDHSRIGLSSNIRRKTSSERMDLPTRDYHKTKLRQWQSICNISSDFCPLYNPLVWKYQNRFSSPLRYNPAPEVSSRIPRKTPRIRKIQHGVILLRNEKNSIVKNYLSWKTTRRINNPLGTFWILFISHQKTISNLCSLRDFPHNNRVFSLVR